MLECDDTANDKGFMGVAKVAATLARSVGRWPGRRGTHAEVRVLKERAMRPRLPAGRHPLCTAETHSQGEVKKATKALREVRWPSQIRENHGAHWGRQLPARPPRPVTVREAG